ncbi:class I mannose-6-phosphate isomerase [Actomonas aquatica]|uniref:Class I mannose-6-phosphate isomerase n=1 Tax=Actomonas aquatica TaxID=2866162 RepID=A0ABZ1C8S4_9BACT|nr:class I mannose-6-phosphate isomerase [Opitutus sp. WL0086]WRQ87873.1 class I mannose-6-phosphate isomerase [Opitutus sp. WL0086]
MPPADSIVLLPPNRVWRSYTGGATLDRIAGARTPADSHLAEDWIGSVTLARNPGRDLPREGVSQVTYAGESVDFADLIASDPDYFLGAAHVARYGPAPMLLVKFLDSATRLHFQCHPPRAFARQHLDSPSGKTEAYHILGVRDGVDDPYIYVGFQRPPTPAQLRDWIERQDMAALTACFDKVPVAPGQTYLIPGGVPHALGEGIFMVEIQEPSDLVARLEFVRDGYVLPEAARFMGRDVDFALSFVDFNAYPLVDGESPFRCRPSQCRVLGPHSWQETLIGPDRTDCFRVCRTVLHEPVTKSEPTCAICTVTRGTVHLHHAGRRHTVRCHESFFLPAGIDALDLLPEDSAELLECFPAN